MRSELVRRGRPHHRHNMRNTDSRTYHVSCTCCTGTRLPHSDRDGRLTLLVSFVNNRLRGGAAPVNALGYKNRPAAFNTRITQNHERRLYARCRRSPCPAQSPYSCQRLPLVRRSEPMRGVDLSSCRTTSHIPARNIMPPIPLAVRTALAPAVSACRSCPPFSKSFRSFFAS